MKKAAELLEPKDLSFLKPVQWGIKNESIAVQELEKKLQIQTQKCGIFVHPDYPYLASSPDRIVFIDNVAHVVEVKCPYSCAQKEINVQNVHYLLLSNGEIQVYLF